MRHGILFATQWTVVQGGTTCVIIKHTNPCGVGVGESALEAFTKAKSTDPLSAFGGIIGFH